MKKLITILLLVTSIISPMIVRAETEAVAEQQTVTYTAKETEAFAILDILGIFTKDDAEIHSNVTRGEFTQIMLKFAGMTQIEINQYDSQLRFPDILNSEYKAAISAACEKGYVVGYDDGYFHPDKYITLNEAVIIIDNVLGYNAFEELKFSNYDLYDDVTTGSNGVINYRAMGMLLFNALHSKVITLKTSDYRSYGYGETALYTFYGVKVDNGIVRANDVSAIDSVEGCTEDYAVIDETEYYDPNSLTFDYLGYNVKAYYDVNDTDYSDDDEIIYVVKGRNLVLEVDAEDVLEKTTQKVFYYNLNDKEKSFDISPVIKVIENYTYVPQRCTEEMLEPDNGKLIFIDYDNNGVYDVLHIQRYSDYYVSGVDTEKGIIYDAYNKDAITTEDKQVTIIKDGKEIKIEDVQNGNVVTAYVSDNYVRLLVSTKTVSGKVTGIQSESENIYTINGTSYETSKDYDPINVKLGVSGKFCLNVFGKICAFEKDMGDNEYGFFLRTFVEYTTDEEVINVRLADDSGTVKSYPFAKNARIYDGTEETKVKEMTYDAIKEKLDVPQVIKYKIVDNEINRIYVSSGSIVDSYDEMTTEQLALNYEVTANNGYYYGLTSRHIDNKWLCTGSTLIFSISVDGEGKVIEDEIKVLSYDKIIQSSTYNLKVYDSSIAQIPSVVLIYDANKLSGSASYDNYKNFVVTKDIYTSVNDDDEIVTVLECYYQGKLIKYTTTNASLFAGFEKGAIGQVALVNGEPYDARVIYYNKDIDLEPGQYKEITYKNTLQRRDVMSMGNPAVYSNLRSESLLVHAYVLEVGSGYVSVQYPYDSKYDEHGNSGYTARSYPTTSNVKIYKVTDNRNGVSLETATITELRDSSEFAVPNGSRVILNTRAGRIDEIFIME